MRKILLLITLMIPMMAFSSESISLKKAVNLALEHNHLMKSSREIMKAGKDDKKAAFTRFLPSFSLLGDYTQLQEKFKLKTEKMIIPLVDSQGNPVYILNPETGQPFVDSATHLTFLPPQEVKFGQKKNYALTFQLTQPIFTGGKIVQQYKIAKSVSEISKSNNSKSKQDLIFETEKSYFRVAKLKEKVVLAEKYSQMINKHLSDLQNMYKVGVITKNDILKIKAKVNEAELLKLKANNGLTLSKMDLAQKIGIDLNSNYQIADTLNIDMEKNKFSKAKLDLGNRPEIKMAKENVKINKSLLNIAYSSYLPNLVLNANYTYLKPDIFGGFENEFGDSWQISLLLQMDLFKWNERGFNTAAAKHRKKAAEEQLKELEEKINLQTTQSLFKYKESMKTVVLAKSYLDQSAENLKMAKGKMLQGMISSSEVLDAEIIWQKAYSEWIDAKANLLTQELEVKKSLGILK